VLKSVYLWTKTSN